MTDITMPALSPTMETGTLIKWHVGVGDNIAAGDVIAEIETDKATMEVEAIDDGTITEILVPEGTEEVKVNSVIARFRGEGEETEAESAAPAPQAAAPAPAEPRAPAKAAPAKAEPARAAPSRPTPPAPDAPPKARPATHDGEGGARIIASPLARRIARQAGIDLASVQGTGPHGRIIRADVDAAAQAAPTATATVSPAAAASPATATPARTTRAGAADNGAPFESIALSGMRKTIARRLTQSKQEVPHYYLTIDTRLDELLALRQQLNRALDGQRLRLSVNDFIIKALALALMRVPDANVSFMGDHLRRYQRADISVAVAIPGGLITPVIRNADRLRLSEISAAMRDLGGRAKDGRLKPEEYTGGTASISNLGMFGVREFSAVINPPEALILAIGAAEKRPVVVDDEITVATVMSVTGSFDHRAIDGAVGAKLLGAFRELIESPLAMLA